jgi:nucleoside-triphosphatase THEP1
MGIYIFSRPIHSGKTTALHSWCKQQENIAGILMPDINGCRKIFDLSTDEIFNIECKDADTKESLISIGKFHFYNSAFEKANTILLQALITKPEWLVIDEAGKLELNGKGFYTAILNAVEVYDNIAYTNNLLLTVRDSLVEDVIGFFKIKHYQIVHDLNNLS